MFDLKKSAQQSIFCMVLQCKCDLKSENHNMHSDCKTRDIVMTIKVQMLQTAKKNKNKNDNDTCVYMSKTHCKPMSGLSVSVKK